MGGRAVEGTGLENRQARERFVGSNPTPSATINRACRKKRSLGQASDFSSASRRGETQGGIWQDNPIPPCTRDLRKGETANPQKIFHIRLAIVTGI